MDSVEFARAPDVGHNVVSVGEKLIDDVAADASGCSENGYLHEDLPPCAAVALHLYGGMRPVRVSSHQASES
jgi:hypothetical protein